MVGSGTGSRWHKLRRIMKLRHGPSAAILPSSVTRIHMEFAKSNTQGHMGPRKFWREMLPSLKFYNPAIPMIVNRKENTEGAALMTIYYLNKDSTNTTAPSSESAPSSTDNAAETSTEQTTSSASPSAPASRIQPPSSATDVSKAAPPAADERVVKIDMKHKHSNDILDLFLAETRAESVRPSPEDEAEIRDNEEYLRLGQAARERNRKYREELMKEQNLLKAAREAE